MSALKLKDALAAEKKPVKSKFEAWIAALDQVDREALDAAATDSQLSNQAILRAVVASGYAVSKDTIAKWRRDYVAR